MAYKSQQFPDTRYVQMTKKNDYHKPELKAAKRVAKLFIFCALLPGVFLTVPLYLRFRVYIQEIYPIGASDMRLIDNKISTTWCQKQLIVSNTTFNAYVIANEPRISKNFENIDMRRSMLLDDGVKEYWGFYLLKGSSVSISACVRRPGATLLVIEGHENLKKCAYVGDNSSEEKDDSVSSEEKRNVTVIRQMTKISPGIVLNGWNLPESNDNQTVANQTNAQTASKIGGKTKNVHLKYAEELFLKEKQKMDIKFTSPKNETIQKVDPKNELTDIVNRLKSLGPHGKAVLKKLRNNVTHTEDESSDVLHQLDQIVKETFAQENQFKVNKKGSRNDTDAEFRELGNEILYHRKLSLKLDMDNETDTAQEVFDENDKVDVHGSVKHNKNKDKSKSEFWSSFSSSEETLLECKGLLISLPLIPNERCSERFGNGILDELALINSASYKVQSTGYYFFIFNNENEVERNFIHSRFQFKKAVYDTTDAVVSCRNETKECSLPLTFWSRERTIVELPSPVDESLWNEEFMFVSKCEPRSILYLICVLSVPLSIFLFAFT